MFARLADLNCAPIAQTPPCAFNGCAKERSSAYARFEYVPIAHQSRIAANRLQILKLSDGGKSWVKRAPNPSRLGSVAIAA